ncbi:MAG TPA: DUF6653 family protein [Marinagarivorans sp.]
MDIMKWAEKLMAMNDATWARHSNPWSVYTRFSALPLISLAVWSREWWGLFSLLPITLALLWVWLNPRLFSVPRTTNNWASMGTFGERIYLNRKRENLPAHHLVMCRLLQTLSALGLPVLIYGLVTLDVWIMVLGNFWLMVFKAWFVDRMVWLYQDLKDSNPRYQSWLIIQ